MAAATEEARRREVRHYRIAKEIKKLLVLKTCHRLRS
jgi:hypothetical protein